MSAHQRSAAEIRAGLTHPVVDADGHLLESLPLLFSTLERTAGPEMVGRFVATLRNEPLTTGYGGDGSDGHNRRVGEARGPWWGLPTDTDYLATVMVPKIFADRLPEFGIDFAVLYPTFGIPLTTIPDDEVRRAAVRALNVLNAELYTPFADRLTPAAAIPMHSPEEAIDELRHCVRELGLKVAMVPPGVARPVPDLAGAFPAVCHVDRFGIDSAHDYDPLWAAFVELGVAPTFHGGVGLRYLPDGRRSPSNYAFNHVLGHAYLQTELCRSLVMGGVPARFPTMRVGFLEGGSGWAAPLLGALEEHWEKRRAEGLGAYDPANLDLERLQAVLVEHGMPADPMTLIYAHAGTPPWVRDEFADAGITDESVLARIFGEQFAYGCESDDAGVHRCEDAAGNPLGVALPTLFSSDIGHWDVPDLREPLVHSRTLVERGLLDDEGYRRFTFDNVVRLHGGMNPTFFEGTTVAAEAATLLAQDAATV